MAHLAWTAAFICLLVALCSAQQQTSQPQVKLEDIERDANSRPAQQANQPGPQNGQEVSQLTPQQFQAAYQQQFLLQPQQYFSPQFTFPELAGVPLTYVPAAGNQLGNGHPNVPQFQAYYIPPQALSQHVVPVVSQPGQPAHPDLFRNQFGGSQFLQHVQHPGPQPLVNQPAGARQVAVVPPNNSVYRTIQPPFGANLIYTNPPQVPQQIIFSQPQPQFAVNAFQQRPSKAQFSSGVKSTPATPTKTPDYSNYSPAPSSAGSASANDQTFRFSG